MIWFPCKQCGKKHSRPDSDAGTMVFCPCGRGNRVPFSSTTSPAAEPLPEAIPVRRPVPKPPPRPVPVARAVPVEVPLSDARPASIPLPANDPPLSYRKTARRYRKVDPRSCWHHEDIPSGGTCSACKLPFCLDCLVELNGQQLCGPCKNFRAAAAGQPARTLPLAAAALVCSLVAGPVALLLSLAGAGVYFSEGSAGGAILLCVVALLMPGASLVVSSMALRRLEAESRLAGRGMAAGGLCVSLASLAWCCTALAAVIGRHAGG